MKQQTQSTKKRVSTKDLVTIGQAWRRRSRKKEKPTPVIVYQVYRHGRGYVLAYPQGLEPRGNLERIELSKLREKYERIEISQGAPK